MVYLLYFQSFLRKMFFLIINELVHLKLYITVFF